jgi:hypothetical protein
MPTETLSYRNVLRICVESRCALRTVENYLRGRAPIRDASKERIQAAMMALDLCDHIPKDERAAPLALVKTG